jgi:hypothetical protein
MAVQPLREVVRGERRGGAGEQVTGAAARHCLAAYTGGEVGWNG